MTRKNYTGAAQATTLAQNIGAADTTILVSAAAGYPTANFVIVLDRGTSTEEKVLIATRNGTSFQVASNGRAYDGSAPLAHNAPGSVEHTLDALTVDEANAHVNDTTRDDHTAYLNTTRHDVQARHVFGGAFPTPAVPPTVGVSGSAGSSAGPARSDHTHAIGAGAINLAAMFGASVIPATAYAPGSVGAAALAALAVSTGTLADLSVTTAKIADLNVTTAKIPDSAITLAKIAAGAVDTTKFAADATPPVPHTSATNIICGSTNGQSLSATYVDWPNAANGTVLQIVGFVKLRADTKLIVQWNGGRHFIGTVSPNPIGFAILANGVDTQIAIMNPQAATELHPSGALSLPGIPAGTYTIKLRVKCTGGANINIDSNTQMSLTVTETF